MTEARAARSLEVWAGVECTVNRVGDCYFDQLERNGHAVRIKDLERLAKLGVSKVRYPVLWERTAPRGIDCIDWSWTDERLTSLRTLGVTPIVGLLHHGSGPRYTNLLDPGFPKKLAAFAKAVAERYPWVLSYTPINEPLTTARFSGLYGHWYPHARDAHSFARALLLQCRGIVLSMRAIREINSDARLLQTEDLGKTFSTPSLSYQAEFENERRWLTFDLLTGRVQLGHPMWDYLRWVGITERDLQWFIDHQCRPDTVGLNHYITSERFLDQRVSRYPEHLHGGNGRQRYADVEAVRVCAEGVAGPKVLIKETWERYGLPIAITEAHLGCTREEQLRWLKTVWEAAQDSRRTGIDVRAVTAWSAFGSYDWNSMLMRDAGHYESGIFDLRAPAPRPTALARMIQTLAHGGQFDHPCLDSQGWWERLDRLCFPPTSHRSHPVAASVRPGSRRGTSSRPLLITGETGTLGRAFARICERRGLAYYLVSRHELDIADADSVASALRQYDPWALINTAGFVRVDDAERERETCLRENAVGPELLAAACAERGVSLMTFSSDLVFNGKLRRPYVESDSTAALNVYGATKIKAERSVLAASKKALIIRTSAFFGPWDSHNFASAVLNALSTDMIFRAASDQTISPTYVPDLVDASLDLLIDGEHGIWHLANEGPVTWAQFARLLAEHAGYSSILIEDCAGHLLGHTARRPTYSALGSERGRLMPTLEDAVMRYVAETNRFLRREITIGSATNGSEFDHMVHHAEARA